MRSLSTYFLGGGNTGEGDNNNRRELGKRYIFVAFIIG